MGPKGCQYIMVYKKSCFSVSCPPERVDLCEPRFVAAEQDTEGTSYYEIVHPLVHNLQEAFREGELYMYMYVGDMCIHVYVCTCIYVYMLNAFSSTKAFQACQNQSDWPLLPRYGYKNLSPLPNA